jgi:hypothetical protein
MMKRIVVLTTLILAAAMTIGASELFFDTLSEAQRYDLADAYNRVADRYEELEDSQKAEAFRAMVQVIFPGFGEVERPVETPEPPRPQRPAPEKPDPAGESASRYYFNKLLRGIFNENISLALSVVAETLYLPLYDSGVDKQTIAAELEWFFENYDVTRMAPADIFQMDRIVTTPLDNGYWRLDVETQEEFSDAMPTVTFWAEKMGFYFRKFPEGWRLAAIGPVA